MYSKFLRIMVVVMAAMLISAQAFACGGVRDRDIGTSDYDQPSMYHPAAPLDRDIQSDQGYNTQDQFMGQEQSEAD